MKREKETGRVIINVVRQRARAPREISVKKLVLFLCLSSKSQSWIFVVTIILSPGGGGAARRKSRREEPKIKQQTGKIKRALTRADNLARGIHSQRNKLRRLRAGQRPKVPVPHQVERTHGTVQRRGDDRVAGRRERHRGHRRLVLGEGHEARPGGRAPHLHLVIVRRGGQHTPIRGVRALVHVEVVPLLLVHVRLRLPLPHDNLAEPGAPEPDPVARFVPLARRHLLLRDGQRVDHLEAARGEPVESKHPVPEPRAEHTGAGMIRGASQLGGHVEKMFPLHSPPANGDAVAAPQGIPPAPRALIPAPRRDVRPVGVLVHQPPLEQGAVLAHRVSRVAAAPREGHVAQLFPVPRQRRRHVPFHVIGAVYPRREVFAAHDDPAGVRGPRQTRGFVVHAAVGS